jgi:mannonate dehydratase
MRQLSGTFRDIWRRKNFRKADDLLPSVFPVQWKEPMKSPPSTDQLNRRAAMKMLATGATAGILGWPESPRAAAQNAAPGPGSSTPSPTIPDYAKGSAPITISKVRAIATAPQGANLVVVKVETSEPGLYGLGCATFTQHAKAVVTIIEDYFDDFCRGKNVDNIEDLWQSMYVSSYWRGGPVEGNALSGVDEALWDIKGKRAKMPLYQLLGGKCRFAVDIYAHASSLSLETLADQVHHFMDQGYRHVRIQQGPYGGAVNPATAKPDWLLNGFGKATDSFVDPHTYLKRVPKMFEYIRSKCGEDVELIHDMHELVEPRDAISMIKQLEPYNPYYIEDPLSPENMKWFKQLRAATTVPLAMGELFNNVNEYRDAMVEQLFDYIRCHVSQIGGITPAMKVARLGEFFNIKTAWHGPPDVSPVGHAAQAHIDLAIWNFGVQEMVSWDAKMEAVFPGAPTIKKGFVFVNEAPGIGVDIDEKEAAKYSIGTKSKWTVRQNDGTIRRP